MLFKQFHFQIKLCVLKEAVRWESSCQWKTDMMVIDQLYINVTPSSSPLNPCLCSSLIKQPINQSLIAQGDDRRHIAQRISVIFLQGLTLQLLEAVILSVMWHAMASTGRALQGFCHFLVLGFSRVFFSGPRSLGVEHLEFHTPRILRIQLTRILDTVEPCYFGIQGSNHLLGAVPRQGLRGQIECDRC